MLKKAFYNVKIEKLKVKVVSALHYLAGPCQARSQFLEVEVLHRQKEEQRDEPPVTAINVSYI